MYVFHTTHMSASLVRNKKGLTLPSFLCAYKSPNESCPNIDKKQLHCGVWTVIACSKKTKPAFKECMHILYCSQKAATAS